MSIKVNSSMGETVKKNELDIAKLLIMPGLLITITGMPVSSQFARSVTELLKEIEKHIVDSYGEETYDQAVTDVVNLLNRRASDDGF
jgi:hypothetical protein